MIKNKKTFKNILYAVIQYLVTIICGFIVPRLIIQTYGSSVNGIISSITKFLGYITLLELGIGPVIKSILYKPISLKNKEEITAILKSSEKFFKKLSLIFIVYVIFLCIIFSLFYVDNYNYIYIASLVLIISLSLFFEYFFGMTYSIYLQTEQNGYVVSIIKTISKIINTIVIIILVMYNFNIHLVKLFSSLIFILTPLFLNFYVKKKYEINLKEGSEYEIKNKYAGLSQHIAAIIHDSSDIAVLTFFTNPLEVSVYSVYMLVINSIKNLSLSFASGIDALFGNLLAKNAIKELDIKFKKFEAFYFTLITILFSVTIILIIPFVKVYMAGINDVNYIRPLFAIIIIFAELVMAIRIPYNYLILSAGHFKQIEKGAWIEAFVNIGLSIILVFNYGLVGVAIGTLIAMLIRTTELIIYANLKILKRNIFISLKKIILILIEVVSLSFIFNKFNLNCETILQWFILASITFVINSIIISLINIFFYKKEVFNEQ